jgi:transcriptional regulator with XRE-family HTH domain
MDLDLVSLASMFPMAEVIGKLGYYMAGVSIKERIKAVRKALNLSQKDFCKGIFISQSLYAKIETGERKPTGRIYELISNKYKVNKEWLITGKGDMFLVPPPDVELEQLMDIIKG